MKVKSESSRAKNRKGFSAKGLGVVLGVLCVAIVGLVVGIVVVNLNKDGHNWNCEDGKDLYDIGVCMEEAYSDNDSTDNIARMYRESIDMAKERGDYKLASDLVIQRTDSLALMDACDSAMELLQQEDFSGYNSRYIGRVYSYAIGVAEDCGDEEYKKEWEELLERIYEENGGEGNVF